MKATAQRGALGFIAFALGVAGTAKLANAQFTTVNFAKWGYPDPAKYVIGAIEVGIGACAVAEIASPTARPVAGVGTICAMSCALATHIRSHDSAANYLGPAMLLAAAGIALTRD